MCSHNQRAQTKPTCRCIESAISVLHTSADRVLDVIRGVLDGAGGVVGTFLDAAAHDVWSTAAASAGSDGSGSEPAIEYTHAVTHIS